MKIYIDESNSRFEVGVVGALGMARVGRGKSMAKAVFNFFIAYQKELGIDHINLNETAMACEMKRRKKELNKR